MKGFNTLKNWFFGKKDSNGNLEKPPAGNESLVNPDNNPGKEDIYGYNDPNGPMGGKGKEEEQKNSGNTENKLIPNPGDGGKTYVQEKDAQDLIS